MSGTFHTTNGIRLHVVEAGPESGQLLIFLHGFPEFWYGWRKQIDFFARAGFRVLVPDQRGYNLSDKPAGIDAYRIGELAADVAGLIDGAGRERAFVVGHDWGAAVGWWLGMRHPGRLHALGLLNVPHPAVFRDRLFRSPLQTLRSWYILFFQLPRLPEWALRRFDWAPMVRALRSSSRPGTFGDEDVARYREAWGQPGAVTAMLNWYRAALRAPRAAASTRVVSPPTLLIWGARDRFLRREMAQPSIELCERGRLVFLEEATHWVQHEEPDAVNRLLREFFDEVERGNGV